jgi:predicted phage replisome organizer
MSDNKKYYYLKLKENFFESDAMIILESMQDGYLYSNILIKLYLRSLKHEGKLMISERIPFNPNILAQVVRHNVGVVEKALELFSELGLVEVLDNGAIYMMDIQNFIGHSSNEADRIREYRNKISNEKNDVQMLQQMYDKSTPEIEIELDKDIEKEIKKEKVKKIRFMERILLTDQEYQSLLEKYNSKELLHKAIDILNNYIQAKEPKYKSHYHVLIGWVYERVMQDVSKSQGHQHTGYTQKDRADEKPKFTFRQKNYL